MGLQVLQRAAVAAANSPYMLQVFPKATITPAALQPHTMCVTVPQRLLPSSQATALLQHAPGTPTLAPPPKFSPTCARTAMSSLLPRAAAAAGAIALLPAAAIVARAK